MRWTRKAIIEEIRKLHAAGEELNYSTSEAKHLNLVRAASWHFGTWKRAVAEAGIDYKDVSKYQRWTPERVVERILELHKAGKDLSWRSISLEVDPPLAAAALRPNSGFKTWCDAITAAGLDHNETARYRRWTEERVLAEIKRRWKENLPLSSIMVQRQDPSLYCAAKRRFSQWDGALTAAGLDPEKIRVRKAPARPVTRKAKEVASSQTVLPGIDEEPANVKSDKKKSSKAAGHKVVHHPARESNRPAGKKTTKANISVS